MATKDITDAQVVRAYADYIPGREWPEDLLSKRTGQPVKVCIRAMERALDRGLIDCGVSLRSGWLTEAGKALLNGTDGD